MYIQIHQADNVLVALNDLPKNLPVKFNDTDFRLATPVAAKHKFTVKDVHPGEQLFMYGVLVGIATEFIPQGAAVTTANIRHASSDFKLGVRKPDWSRPDVSAWQQKTFDGYHRSDGSVGTANHWLVIPLVFCENRNIEVLREAFVEKLGYKRQQPYDRYVQHLVDLYQSGTAPEEISAASPEPVNLPAPGKRLFPNIDGIKFLVHEMGCGGTRDDSDALCGLLAGYITHSNVAGATVLSLGCQNAQASILKQEIIARDPGFSKPLIVLDQQHEGTEEQLINKAINQTFTGLIEANAIVRRPAPLSKLCIGLECGGSDGFSGISANPAVGLVSDRVVALGGSVILSEFPELCGVEQSLSDRCIDTGTANRFMDLMRRYNSLAERAGSGFYANPSPGNIRDGLLTDAMKSAGAARKGGASPVTAVLDYPEKVTKPGLNLLCTPGNDVESTTAEVAAGANIVLFTTGLGTPTGNPVAPVIKLSTNTRIFERMPDIIDLDCGPVIDGRETLAGTADRILDLVIEVASGRSIPKAVGLGQDDFIPWKRGVSL